MERELHVGGATVTDAVREWKTVGDLLVRMAEPDADKAAIMREIYAYPKAGTRHMLIEHAAMLGWFSEQFREAAARDS